LSRRGGTIAIRALTDSGRYFLYGVEKVVILVIEDETLLHDLMELYDGT
jgi:hypothetical protein